MTPLEKEIEAKLVDAVKAHGGKCLKFVSPGWRGVPDRIILLPGGRVIFAEVKRPVGGRLNEMQKWWHRELEKLGFLSVTVWDTIGIVYIKGLMEVMKNEDHND